MTGVLRLAVRLPATPPGGYHAGMAAKRQRPQKATGFSWSPNRERAAQLLAEDDLSDEEIAKIVRVNRKQLWKWKCKPEFQAKIEELQKRMGNIIHRRGIARKTRRLAVMDRRYEGMQQIMRERAAAQEMQDVPGGKSGQLVHTIKSVGGGENAQVVDEYEFDAALAKEMRELEKQAAVEVGQWEEKRDITSGGKRIAFVEVPKDDDGETGSEPVNSQPD